MTSHGAARRNKEKATAAGKINSTIALMVNIWILNLNARAVRLDAGHVSVLISAILARKISLLWRVTLSVIVSLIAPRASTSNICTLMMLAFARKITA